MKLINLFTLIVLCVSQLHSMIDSGQVDPFVSVPGARPFAIKLKADVAAECKESFEAFRKAQQIARDKAAEYKAVESFASNVIRTTTDHPDIHALDGIREWISKPANAGAAHTAVVSGQDRILTVDLETLADVLNVRAKKSVTAGEIAEYIAAASQANGQSRQYSLLMFFARTILKYQQYELDSLNSWLSGSNAMTTASSSSAVLKCDISLVFKLISARAGRNIVAEFGRFVEEYNEKEGRVFLKQDFDAFTMGSGTVSSGMPMHFEHAILIENGMETTKQAFPKGFDVSIPLAAVKDEFLGRLMQECGGESRIYGRFIIKGQSDFVSAAHRDLATASSIEIRDGFIYQGGELLNTTDTIWALSHEGTVRIYPQKQSSVLGCSNHHYLFQKEGVGMPVACAGHLEANGKISKINRSSGHYMPTELQFILAITHLNALGIIADNVILNENSYSTGYRTLAEALSVASMIELG